jgi:hypothetical protein
MSSKRMRHSINGDGARPWLRTAACSLCVLCAAALLAAQSAQDAPPAEDEQEKPRDTGSSLDELLGLDEDEREARAEEAARMEAEEALRRRLDEQAPGEALAEAVRKMTISAELLETRLDPGLGTQRVQEEVLAHLTHLINEAARQRMSSASQQQQQQQRQRQQQQDPGRREQQSSQPQDQSSGESQEGDPPGSDQVDVNLNMEETGAEWGTLPARIRDMLLQGRQERFSSLYEQLTRDYYRRLAED